MELPMADSSLQAVTGTSKVDTGITTAKRKQVAETLSQALADSFTLYLKTLGVHWNVVGPAFFSIHKLTEAQYVDLDEAIDAIAERIRSLGHVAPASFGDFGKLSEIKSDTIPKTADEMLDTLIADNEAAAKRMRDFVAAADEADDVYTADMLTARIGKHEENAWMLRSMRG
jgi:starvation-inducible DNA-binding protein